MSENQANNDAFLDSAALLVVDVQEPFLKALPNRDPFLRRCQFAVRAASLLSIRVLFTEQIPEKLGPVHPSLLDGLDHPNIFAKSAFSALGARGLPEFLEANEIEHLILAGLETPICIYQTAIAAINKDCIVTVLSDCTGARRLDDAAAALAALEAPGCHVLPAETVFYSILADATHPKFREFTALIKSFNQETTPSK